MVISLGPNCRNTWNLRKYFNFDRAYPFDWWITPAKSMLKMINPAFDFRLKKEDLLVTGLATNGKNSVYNRRLNLLHHHDFNRIEEVVQEVIDKDVERLEEKYRFLFSRMKSDFAQATRPLAVLNGINSGWCGKMSPDGVENTALNGPVAPQALIEAIREQLGRKVEVLIVKIGEQAIQTFEGGAQISFPDTGKREALRDKEAYFEPVHVFKAAYQAMSLPPGLIHNEP